MDGFPRTIPQAEAVDRMLAVKQARVDRVVLLEVPEAELVQRLLSRAAKEGRADDNQESITQRLKVFHQQTAPLIAFYEGRGIVKRVDGQGDVDAIAQRMRQAAV
jgi:adenylate kinase